MKVNNIRVGRKVVAISPLEEDVLNMLWKSGSEKKVREIYNNMKGRRKVALTSIAVILDRLHSKGMVSRKAAVGRGGSHYIYSTKISRSDFEQSIVEKTVDRLIDNFGPVAVTYFNKRFAKGKR